MNRFPILLSLALAGAFFLSWLPRTQAPAADCEVLIEALAGTYEGDCKKGQAHGIGTATGVDTYTGEFKKGLPDGEGVYTWANGDVYKGSFKRGLMDGAGTLTHTDGTPPLVGFWVEDEYIGTEKEPYAVTNRSTSINRVSFRRLAAEPLQVDFKYTFLNKPVPGRDFAIQGSFGVILNETDYIKSVKIHEFPFQGGTSFSAVNSKDATGGNQFTSGNIEFKINQPGHWEVTIEMRSE